MKAAKQVIKEMADEMPFLLTSRTLVYIEEALKIYAKEALKEAAGQAKVTFIECDL